MANPPPDARWTTRRAFALAAALLGCGSPPDDTLTRIHEEGFIRAGYAQEPPYAFARLDGSVDGESPEAFRHALGAAGVDSIRWVRLDFEDLIPALEAGRVDVVASGLFPTPERRERARFSGSTFCARAALAYRCGEPPPAGLERFAAGGAGRLAVVAGTVEERAADVLGIPEALRMAVPDVATGLAALRAGAVRALALTAPSLRSALAGDAELDWTRYDPPPAVAGLVEGCSALAFRTTDSRLVELVDEGLAGYVGTSAHGAVLERLELVGTGSPPMAGRRDDG